MALLDLGNNRNEKDRLILLTMICLVAGILTADVFLPLGFVIWILYLMPLLMSVYLSYRYAPFLTAWVISGAILLGGIMAQASHLNVSDMSNRAVFILMEVIIALLVWEIQTNYTNLEKEIAARSAAEKDLKEINLTLEKRVQARTHELSGVNEILTKDIAERRKVETALYKANQKLNLLGSITRHDILNRVFVLLLEIDLIKEDLRDSRIAEHIEKLKRYAHAIETQIKFTKDYQDVGIQAPQWYDVRDLIKNSVSLFNIPKIEVGIACEGIEVFADPMIEKVFYNLIDNALRHGGAVTIIAFTCHTAGDGLVIVCEDNGAGIDPEFKRQLFTKGVGKHTGFGLFLIREILGITGITIEETGEPGKGARFEITVPAEGFRISPPAGNVS